MVALVLSVGCGPMHAAPTSSSCPGDRDLVLSSQEDVMRASACASARSVTIRTGAAVDVSPMRALAVVKGDLTIGPTVGMNEVAFPHLRSIGGALGVASNGSLRGLFLPRLETAGRISVEANVSLATISIPELIEVAGSIRFASNAELELIEISSLATVADELVIADNPKLVLIEAGRLARARSVRVERNGSLPMELGDALRAKTAPR